MLPAKVKGTWTPCDHVPLSCTKIDIKAGKLINLNTDIATVSYNYDKDGVLLQEKNSTTNEVTKYRYNMLSQLTEKDIWQKDKLETSQKYEYDLLGRKTKEIIDGDYKMYFYDSFDRLKEVVEGDSSIEDAYSKGKITNYVYDPYSNIIEKSIWQDNGRLKESYTYNQNNQLTSKKVEDKAELFRYDKQGNLVNKKEVLPGGTYFTNYIYDGKNRLETVNNNDEISASYTYRYDGLRHSKTVDGETKYFTYNGGNITSELTSSGTYNYYRGSSMIGIKDPAGEKYYFTQNNKGDIISLKDATGNNVDTYSYDAFGNKNEDTEKLFFQGEWEKETSEVYNPFGYCGEYFDEETGFVYLRGRYYDPATERFITEDPTKDGANWYAYCGNDPVNYIDPSGYAYTSWDKANGVNKKIIDKASKLYNKAYKANDKKGMETAHKMAEKERNKHRSKHEVGMPTGDTIRNDQQIRAFTQKEEIAYKVNKVSPYIPGNNLKTAITGSNYGGYCPVTERDKQDAKEGVIVDIGTALVGAGTNLSANLLKGGSKVAEDVLPIGGKITGYTEHGLNQAIGRDGGKGVATKAILDTVKNPLKIVEQQGKYGTTFKYVGKNAVVVLNEAGEVVTTYAKGSAGLRGVK